ncbi:hypothetical protein NGI46_13820 [Peribacillus butanolivorans]|nr:hypothetical protein [Peribacillus butanolivorans]
MKSIINESIRINPFEAVVSFEYPLDPEGNKGEIIFGITDENIRLEMNMRRFQKIIDS